MANFIHPTAIISEGVKLGKEIHIGPYCILDGNITVGDGCILMSHVSITGNVEMGFGNKISPFASIGGLPQDIKSKDFLGHVKIGDENVIRENVTINLGTNYGSGVTKIGNKCVIMACVHIGHDSELGNRVILANNVLLGGHVVLDDFVRIGGNSGVHQFIKIGKYAMIGGLVGVNKNVPPYSLIKDEYGKFSGLNLVGIRRNLDMTFKDVKLIEKTLLFLMDNKQGTVKEKIETIKEDKDGKFYHGHEIIDFFENINQYGVCEIGNDN